MAIYWSLCIDNFMLICATKRILSVLVFLLEINNYVENRNVISKIVNCVSVWIY